MVEKMEGSMEYMLAEKKVQGLVDKTVWNSEQALAYHLVVLMVSKKEHYWVDKSVLK
jgi:hypothetical protein